MSKRKKTEINRIHQDRGFAIAPKGILDIYPSVIEGKQPAVTIIGNPDGLRYLAELLHYLADFDQSMTDGPKGSREHFHLHAGDQLGKHSCEVELCRADAKGTGDLPDFVCLGDQVRKKRRIGRVS